jgi:inner membrane transporter RhtA
VTSGYTGALGLVLAAILCQQVGAALAVLVFPTAGPLGMVFLRLFFSAVVLLAFARPRLHGHGKAAWWTAAGFGVAMAAMNSFFYAAIDRLPLGVAVTLEVLGPLVLSVIASRRLVAVVWAVLAFAGVALISGGTDGAMDPIGVLFALGAAACWAFFILLNARTGAAFPGLAGLALAMAFGTIITVPGAALAAGTALLDPVILAVGLGVALMSSALPYAFELIALRRIPAATFSVLTCLAPAVAALAGFAVLGQELGWSHLAAIALVIAASIGAVRTSPQR